MYEETSIATLLRTPAKVSAADGINPIIAASTNLLNHATGLRERSNAPPFDSLHPMLCEEIKLLENTLHHQGYTSQVVLAARYLLCALIDETLLTHHWNERDTWEQYQLTQTFAREQDSHERFFTILERSSAEPQAYIDLLELGYLCLSLGYQGPYRHKPNQELIQVMDNLYQLIRLHRPEPSRQLLLASSTAPLPSKSRWKLPPIWVTALMTLIVLALLYLPYKTRLEKITHSVYQSLQEKFRHEAQI